MYCHGQSYPIVEQLQSQYHPNLAITMISVVKANTTNEQYICLPTASGMKVYQTDTEEA